MKIDETMWPITVFSLGDTTTDDDWRRMLAHYDAIYARRQVFFTITNGVSIRNLPSAGQRKLIAELARDRAAQAREWCIGSAVVLPSAVARGVMTAITWLAPPVNEQTFHETYDEALREAVRALQAKGIVVPESVPRSHRPAQTGTR
jgi:hypothetical protein